MSRKASPFNTALAGAIATAIAAAGLVAEPRFAEASTTSLSARQAAHGTYIVRFAEAPLATYRGGVAGIAAAPRLSIAGRPAKLDARAPQSLAYVAYLTQKQNTFLSAAGATLGRPLQAKFTYTHALNGMAVDLTAHEAAQLAKMPDVVSVRKSQLRKLSTDSGPAWIGAPSVWQGTSTGGLPGTQGEGMLIGVIDTGINFDSPSFAATDADGYQHVNPLGAGTHLGTCAAGGVDVGRCNDKLIGAYTFLTSVPPGSPDVADSAVDHFGHGSHTASTAGGNHAEATTSDGATVAVSGVAPRANVIMYKVCYAPAPGGDPRTCPDDAGSAAADQAVADGVDAINFSISGGSDPWSDDTSIAFRNAVEAGIFVAAAAGNTSGGSNATPGTVDHLEPWTITVGASTHDRFYSNVHVEVPGLGTFTGANGILDEDETPAYTAAVTGPLVASTGDATACTSFTAPPSAPANFIAVIRAGCTFSDQVNNAEEAGAAAVVIYHIRPVPPMVMYMPDTTIPALMISQEDGQALTAYMLSNTDATATADLTTPPTFDHVPAYGDVMGNFSLLGPAGGTTSPWDLLKPEITAPGVSILAAVSGAADAYGFMQGTSMATPHVTGSGTLLRALHPDWTPMEIKSALMLTAKQGVRKLNATAIADPFDRGAGRTDLTRAAASPLVMNETAANMEAANPDDGGDLSTLNEPSLSKAACAGTCTFTRVFRNPTATAQSFTAAVQPSNGGALSGTVAPASFSVEPGATQSVTITIDVGTAAANSWSFGEVTLTPESGDALTLPVAVRKTDAAQTGPSIEVAPAALDSSQAPDETKTQTLAVENTGDAPLTWTIGEQLASVILSVGGHPSGIDTGLGHGVRGGTGACTALADVPWLSATPESGTTAADGSSDVTVTFDSTGLAAGSYSANVCVNSNDTEQPVVAVPVTMTVTGGGGGDVIFADGFDAGGGGETCKPLQLLQDPSFEATTEAFGTNPSWASIDSHDDESSVFCNGDCIEGGGDSGARTGDWFSWFGGWSADGTDAYTAYASQSVTIPSGSARFLNFWKKADRISSDATADTFKVTVDGTEVHSEAVTAEDEDYVVQSVDVSAHADGASHEVKFTFAHTGTAGDGSYFLDDVTLDCSAQPASSSGPVRRANVAGQSKRPH